MALGIACAGTGLKVSNSVLTRVKCSNQSPAHFFWLVNDRNLIGDVHTQELAVCEVSLLHNSKWFVEGAL
jgi:hypothetical protein